MKRNYRVMARTTALVLLFSVLVFAPTTVGAEQADWDIPGGHFYTQTGGGGGLGFAVTDEGGIPFWSEFNRLGGVNALGYPVSQRFQWNGFTCQAMQRVVLQWQPSLGQVMFVNVFDIMHESGKDDWLLAVRQTPKPLGPDFDANLDWSGIVAKRLALLDANPAIKAQYYATVRDPIQMNGLPTSPVTDMGNNYTLRAQRIVIQQWKETVPWAAAGQVTVALGGSIAKEAGLIPASAVIPSYGANPSGDSLRERANAWVHIKYILPQDTDAVADVAINLIASFLEPSAARMQMAKGYFTAWTTRKDPKELSISVDEITYSSDGTGATVRLGKVVRYADGTTHPCVELTPWRKIDGTWYRTLQGSLEVCR